MVRRHDDVKNEWAGYLREHQDFNNVVVEQVLPGANEDTAPRLDVTAVDASGQVVALDITIANPCTSSALAAGSAAPGHFLRAAKGERQGDPQGRRVRDLMPQ